MREKITAPWTPEQVEALNAWQKLGYVHEFTCPRNHEGSRILVAHADGWKCPTCHSYQNWAHDFMADKAKHPKPPFAVAFQCPDCGMVSRNPNDIANLYCGNCHKFFADEVKP